MVTTTELKDGYLHLWPTILVQRHLPDATRWNEGLLKRVEELDRANENLTTDYLGDNFFDSILPPVVWLRDGINKTVADYLNHCDVDYPLKWAVQGWPNVNRFGDYHESHNHPRAYLSGTYYVRVPKAVEPLKFRKDAKPGCITFYDPRVGLIASAIAKDPYIDPAYTVMPESGFLLMWPAMLQHFVHPNLSKEKRVSISFNIMLKFSESQIPDQR